MCGVAEDGAASGFPLENSSVLKYIMDCECIFFASEVELERRD